MNESANQNRPGQASDPEPFLTEYDRIRYDRQIMLPGFGESGQQKLKEARVFIAGAGGLGSSIAIYLAAAGIGTIRIADDDKVELSNLNRQVIHTDADIGRFKIDSALEKLGRINPAIHIEGHKATIDDTSVADLSEGCHAIIDAMDNLPTRYLLNKTALGLKLPFFYGGVNGFEGRAMTVIPGQSACLRCMYRGPVEAVKFPVVGMAPAVIGAIEATEVIKYFTGIGTLLTNRLLVYDGLEMKFTQFKIKQNPNCDHCGLKCRL